MKLKTKIKMYRAANDMTQDQLASLVDVRRETINNLEKGKYNPSLKLAMMIAKVFDCQVEELFSYDEEEV